MQKLTPAVERILNDYPYEPEGVLSSMARMLMHGRLGGTGRMLVYPVDQGFEHGPARTFAPNPAAYDPDYLVALAAKSGVSAHAGTPGQLMAAARLKANVPLIMKLNSASSLQAEKDNAVTGMVDDAAALGCAAIGYTLYPGSEHFYRQVEKLVPLIAAARARGMASVVWSYPRGGTLGKDGETALDIVAYGARIAAELGAQVIKVKLPTAHIEQGEARAVYDTHAVSRTTQAERVRHVMQCCFAGRRIVLFSGGPAKSEESVVEDAKAIRDGGGHGSILGRNITQRGEADALALITALAGIYAG